MSSQNLSNSPSTFFLYSDMSPALSVSPDYLSSIEDKALQADLLDPTEFL